MSPPVISLELIVHSGTAGSCAHLQIGLPAQLVWRLELRGRTQWPGFLIVPAVKASCFPAHFLSLPSTQTHFRHPARPAFLLQTHDFSSKSHTEAEDTLSAPDRDLPVDVPLLAFSKPVVLC